ncbi:sugar ABC transporter ATP-binding protein [Roseovarius aestuarii]|nr:sugar ABC transporter ATP-binding protein [Roseovarius aestuarii]
MPLLEAHNLSKHYAGVAALTEVDFSADAGEIHALVGANGAGKSTLMTIIAGANTPSEGTLSLDGVPLRHGGPAAAQAQGIATVYQEFSLVPHLSVARNIFLGREPVTRLGLVDRAGLIAQTCALLDRFAITLDPMAEVGTLSVAQQQMVEIARALSQPARILILDEPTAVLSLAEQENLFRIMRRLRADGMLVLYVSHYLNEVLEIADRITVLRDGRIVGTRKAKDLQISDLVQMMIGRDAPVAPTAADSPERAANFVITYATHAGQQELTMQAGEIVGLAGLVGAGRTTFGRAIAGLHRPGAIATLTHEGALLNNSTPRQAMRAGIAYLTEDRKKDGLFAGLDIVANATAAALPRTTRGGFRRPQVERAQAEAVLKRLHLVAARLGMPVAQLSGGNQQKVVLGRALMTEPRLLICDEPTRGVDIGAKAELHQIIRDLAANGAAVLIISSEFEELQALAHRIVVMRDRCFVADLPVGQADQQEMLIAASGGPTEKETA